MRISYGVGLAALLVAVNADAFCGFYVSGADAKLFNNATQVVLLRDGTRTVLSMQNDYEGPPESFALVVPVPVVLQKENVKTLDKAVFAKVDQMTAPRLVEYWEQDPCGGYGTSDLRLGGGGGAARARSAAPAGAAAMDLGVTVEAQFEVGEYDIVILSAKDSSGLETWLKQEKYEIPKGSEPFLRPYVQNGSKFFVAKVDAKRVKFEKGHAALSPLRFHYDSNDFSLPVRLGLVNSRGTQDIVINILAKERYEPANYPSVTIPTNIDLAEGSKEHFGRFYTALFDRTIEKNPKAIVTEYSWNASSCDPCPGPTLSYEDFAKLGADALPDAQPGNPQVTVGGTTGSVAPATMQLVSKRFLQRMNMCWTAARGRNANIKSGRVDVKIAWREDGKLETANVAANDTGDKELDACVQTMFKNAQLTPEKGNMTISYSLGMGTTAAYRPWTLTRLHARYTKESLGEDIVFKVAPAITGGREVRNEKGDLERGATKVEGGGGGLGGGGGGGAMNNFQGRYAIRHPWVGPMDCENPQRGRWGGPWHELGLGWQAPVAPASSVAFAPRGGADLTDFVRSDVSEIGVKAGKGPLPAKLAALAPAASGDTSSSSPSTPSTAGDTRPSEQPPKSSCGGCTMIDAKASGASAFSAIFALLVTFARRRAKTRS
jgi:hypothetical protein